METLKILGKQFQKSNNKFILYNIILKYRIVFNFAKVITKSFTVPRSETKKNLPKIILSGTNQIGADAGLSGNKSDSVGKHFNFKFKYSPETLSYDII